MTWPLGRTSTIVAMVVALLVLGVVVPAVLGAWGGNGSGSSGTGNRAPVTTAP